MQLLAGALDEDRVAGRTVVAPEAASRRMPVTIPLEAHVRARDEFHVPDRPHSASPLAGAALIGSQLVALDPERIVGLDVLDRVVARVGVQHVDRVDAVLAEAAAIGALSDV